MGTVLAFVDKQCEAESEVTPTNLLADITTGFYQVDCLLGRDHAEGLILAMSTDPDQHAHFVPMMLELLVSPQMSGIHIGFFQQILELAISGMAAKT